MTRWSTPSKRPHKTTTPGPSASCSHAPPGSSGAPRALRYSTGRAGPGRGRGIERARHHVGPHDHAGAAAERQVVDAAVPVGRELAQVERLERPDALLQRAPGERMAERPGEHLREQGQHGRGPGRAHRAALRAQLGRRHDHQAAARATSRPAEVDGGTVAVERQAQHVGRRRPHLEHVARAEIADRAHGAEARAIAELDREAFEIGVVELVRPPAPAAPRAARTAGAAQRLGRVAIIDAVAPWRGRRRGVRPITFRAKRRSPSLVVDRAVGTDVLGALGEAAELERALQAVRGHDLGHAHPPCRSLLPGHRRVPPTSPAATGVRRWRLRPPRRPSWPRSPGPACRCRAWRTVSAVIPAPSRKRATRSLGLAPLSSQ